MMDVERALVAAEQPFLHDRTTNTGALVALAAEVRRLRTWHGLMSVLDQHYPPDVPLGPDDDPGPRILRLVRELGQLRDASPYYTCGCGRQIHIPAVADLVAMRERAEHLAEHHPDPAAARAALWILGRERENKEEDR